ncbi:uncharacterized protein ARMOST_04625 [Armillaria ostoyae]|uniref:Uncharacterized protein n=1 Tax=Armillaria ostoyae TaxID=47428 RepID=A0A284QY15_ARMOS|nr:uncharacterized protein ARMOST_04625 [Armillaria ostoyae]
MYQEGGEKSDGEAPERVWAMLNPVAMQMKEMQLETRHDALEDKIDRHNYHKNTRLGETLERQLKIATEERDIQIQEFIKIDSTLEKDLRADWIKKVKGWNEDHSKPSPYLTVSASCKILEADVKLNLCWEELEEIMQGKKTVKSQSLTVFLTTGLELENAQ